MTLIDKILQGDPRAMARAMTLIENGDPAARAILRAIFPRTGKALVIGVTGAPGSGKSTLVDKLAQAYRKQDKTVGIVAVDPTSPFSGGAILADRVRMQALYNDEGVFIRSMATRGQLGGLAQASQDVAAVLDASGKDIILIETVGVGQDEVDIVKVAQVSIVVLVPGMGDDLQAFKAGIMEIGDVFVINKADRPDVDRMQKELEGVLSLAARADGWNPPIVRTVATHGEGIADVLDGIAKFHSFRNRSAAAAKAEMHNAQEHLIELFKEHLFKKAIQQNGIWDKIQAASAEVTAHQKDPYTAVEEIARELGEDWVV